MKFFSKTFIFSICYIVSVAHAATTSSHRNIFRIIKVDTNKDGIANILIYEKSNMSVTLALDGQRISRIEIHNNRNNLNVTAKYKFENNKFSLTYAYATSARYFYNENACSSSVDNSMSLSALGSLASEIETQQNINFSPSCSKFPDLKKQISSSFSNLNSLSLKDSVTSCLQRYDATAAGKWKAMPNGINQFGCADTSFQSGRFDSKTKEITISESCLKKNSELSDVLKEEILHSFGIRDENLAKCLAKCPSMDQVQSCNAVNAVLRSGAVRSNAASALDGSISYTVADDYNSAKTIEVPKEIAVAQVPQPTMADLKMSHSVESSTVEDSPSVASAGSGTSAHSYSASSYPNSMMQFASTAILPEKAYAASSSSVAASDSSSRGNRSASSASAPARRESFSRLPASDSSLTNPNYSGSVNPVDARAAASGKNAVAAMKVQSRGRSTAGSDGTATSGNASSPGAASLGSAGSSSTNARSQRLPASVSNSSDLTRYFQTAPYNEIKQRLRDPQFIQDLKKNSTTVFDAQGHRFGASQGQVIFSDKGNRFVKEK